MNAPIVVECCLCPRVKGGEEAPPDAQRSHGLCPDCWDRYRAANGLKPLAYTGGVW